MACFPLCKSCSLEFEDPDNRRYHAEPNACPDCGPKLSLLDRQGNEIISENPILDTIEFLSNGQIVVIKGLGGFHLCVDAYNNEAVNKLREVKFREEKPFAIMLRDVLQAAELCEINEHENELLLSSECPIVLLEKKKFSPIAKKVAENVPCLGIMLPYTPLQHLLFESSLRALIMTSANKKDEPICIGNREVIKKLSGIADYFLVHNRDILVRNDDSIAMVSSGKPVMLRRSRGYVPSPISLGKSYPEVLALGSYLKSTACIVTGKRAYLSPHIGDLETPEARDFLMESVNLIKSISKTSPKTIACDMHPEYFSTALAKQLEPENFVQVQHHHAHIVSCMAENHVSGDVIGIAMDGTGYGPDNTVWGGEFLIADEKNFTRAGHLKNIIIPGGESSIRQIWRIALSLIKEIHPGSWKQFAKELNFRLTDEDLELFESAIEKKVNCFTTSSLGRLFDAVSCLLGIKNKVSFEGQAAMELESIAELSHNTVLGFSIYPENNSYILDLMPAIKDIIEMRINHREPKYMATAFHLTLVNAFTNMAERIREEENLNRVLLSGGCFQNRILLEGCVNRMEKKGFEVITHSLVPSNDGGISLGQAVCAASRLQ
jgi:hydrogenase maturation protein HypF